MNWLVITAIIIVLIVITFLLLIFMPKPHCYFSFDDIGDELKELTQDDNFEIIQKNLSASISNYDNDIIMLYDNGKINDNFNTHLKLYELMEKVPNVKRIFFKRIKKKTKKQIKRRGLASFANNTLRCVLPIKISAYKKTGMWLDGESKFYKNKEMIIYDDSRENSYYNKHKNDTHLLVIDIERPNSIPKGISLEKANVIF